MSDNLTSTDLASPVKLKILWEFVVVVNMKRRHTTTLHYNVELWKHKRKRKPIAKEKRKRIEAKKQERDSLCQGKGRKLWCTHCAPACPTIILVKCQCLVRDISCWEICSKEGQEQSKSKQIQSQENICPQICTTLKVICMYSHKRSMLHFHSSKKVARKLSNLHFASMRAHSLPAPV